MTGHCCSGCNMCECIEPISGLGIAQECGPSACARALWSTILTISSRSLHLLICQSTITREHSHCINEEPHDFALCHHVSTDTRYCCDLHFLVHERHCSERRLLLYHAVCIGWPRIANVGSGYSLGFIGIPPSRFAPNSGPNSAHSHLPMCRGYHPHSEWTVYVH